MEQHPIGPGTLTGAGARAGSGTRRSAARHDHGHARAAAQHIVVALLEATQSDLVAVLVFAGVLLDDLFGDVADAAEQCAGEDLRGRQRKRSLAEHGAVEVVDLGADLVVRRSAQGHDLDEGVRLGGLDRCRDVGQVDVHAGRLERRVELLEQRGEVLDLVGLDADGDDGLVGHDGLAGAVEDLAAAGVVPLDLDLVSGLHVRMERRRAEVRHPLVLLELGLHGRLVGPVDLVRHGPGHADRHGRHILVHLRLAGQLQGRGTAGEVALQRRELRLGRVGGERLAVVAEQREPGEIRLGPGRQECVERLVRRRRR